MIAQFNALLIMALHHGQQDPIIAHFIILKVSRLLIHVQRTHMFLCKDRKHQCVTLGFKIETLKNLDFLIWKLIHH